MNEESTCEALTASARVLSEIRLRSETLWERLERTRGEAEAEAPTAEALARALLPWAKAVARGDLGVLSKRLSWDEVTTEEAYRAVTAEAPDVADETGDDWTADLQLFSLCARQTKDELDRDPGIRETLRAHATGPFPEIWLPWRLVAAEKLANLPAKVRETFGSEALQQLLDVVHNELTYLGESAAFKRFETLRAEAGGNPSGIHDAFVGEVLSDPIAELYQHYPVLARQQCRTLGQWMAAVRELSTHIEAARPLLVETFCGAAEGTAELGPVATLEGGLGDRHRDGRQVLRLVFANGLELIYKPRSLAAEVAWRRILEWCREAGLLCAPATARALDCGDHGFMEAVVPSSPIGQAGAEAYYRTAGSLVALAYVLRAEDLHGENLIATASGPVVIDAELMLQPMRAVQTTGEGREPSFLGSVLASALLTQLLPGGEEDRDLGGLRWPRERLETRRGWTGLHGDELAFAAEEKKLPPRENVVTDENGNLLPIEDWSEAVEDGFSETWRFLTDERGALEELLRSELAETTTRVLLRPTREYGQVVQLTSIERNQKSGTMGSLLRDALASRLVTLDQRPEQWPLLRAERIALERLDIPWFGLAANTTEIETETGEIARGLFETAGLDAVCGRLQALDERDHERQLRRLRLALAPDAEISPVSELIALSLQSVGDGPFEDACLAMAWQIAELVRERVLEQPPAGWSLSTGRLGPAVLFAELATSRPETRPPGVGEEQGERFAAIARQLSACDRDLTQEETEALRDMPLGGPSGLGGVLFVLNRLSETLGETVLRERALLWSSFATNARIEADRSFDLDGGCAGLILGLLELHRGTGAPETLERAIAAGDHLLAHQRSFGSLGATWNNAAGIPQPGLAHGAAGIATALAHLGEATGKARFTTAALAAIAWERGMFDSQHGNWPALVRDHAGDISRVFMASVCRGAPGIAIARQALPPSLRDSRLAAEIETAQDTTFRAEAASLDHLCCGALGRTAALTFTTDDNVSLARREQALTMARAVVARAGSSGHFRRSTDLYDNRTPDAGFHYGLSGIAYQLYCLAAPARAAGDFLVLVSQPREAREP